MIQLMLIVGALGCLALAGLMLHRNHRRALNVLAALINICIAIWSVAILLFLYTTDPVLGAFYAKAYYVAAALFAATLLLFALVFPGKRWPAGFTVSGIVAAGVGMSLLVVFMPLFIADGVTISSEGNHVNIVPVTYLVYCVYFIFFFAMGLGTILLKFTKANSKIKAQAGLYLIGILCMAIPGLVTNLALPYFQIYSYIWIGPAMSAFFIGIITYSIVRHGMFDIKLVAVRTLAYILSIGTLSAIYVGGALSLSGLVLGELPSTQQGLVNATLALLVAFLLPPIKRFFDRITNRLFYRDDYDTGQFYTKLNRTLAGTTDLRNLLTRVSDFFAVTFKASQVFFFIENEERYISAGTNKRSKLPTEDARQLDAFLERSGRPIILLGSLNKEDPEERSLRRLMIAHKLQIIIPLHQGRRGILGYVCLGDHLRGMYSHKDIQVLQTIADELVIAIQNALSVQQIKELNATLQQRIDEATKELRTSNAQLRRLDEAKDEFVSMASHQLRTPLTSVKGYLDMVIEGDAGEITATQRKLLSEAFTSSERMVHLINDFLNVSRLQTGKFMIDQRPVDLVKLVTQEIDSLRTSASQRDLSFRFDHPRAVPKLLLDEGKFRQVVMNFADNAIYYSKEGSIIKIRIAVEGDALRFTVTDTGIGVPASEQADLFGKFYRASNARKQRPDGTGVGLFLAKKVIVAHGGTTIFESVEGKGSTFGFQVPIAKLRVRSELDKDND